MKLKTLGINVTKECNLNCAHCLCGDSVKESVTKEVVQSTFKGIDEIGELYLTGGEPLGKPELIKMITQEYKKQGVKISKISLTTNATIFNDEVKSALLYLFDGVQADLTVSVDNYHKQSIFQKFNGFDKVFVGRFLLYNQLVQRIELFCKNNGINFYTRDICPYDIIVKMGRAKSFQNAIKVSRELYALGNYYPKEHLYTDDVTIDTSGAVLRCDYENEEVEDLSIGNVLDDNLEHIIFNKCVSELEQRKISCKDSKLCETAINLMYEKRNLKNMTF